MNTHSRHGRHPIVEEDLEAVLRADLPWERLDGKTVLITGAGGFLPAYLVETLLYRNECLGRAATQVVGLVRSLEKAQRRFAVYAGRPDLHFVTADVCEPFAYARPLDIVIHAASQASPKFYGADPVGTLSANVLGTHRLLALAQKQGAERFLFFSSSEVYGQLGDIQASNREDTFGVVDPTQVRACYAESKRMGETLCVAWHHQYGLETVIVRPFHTYGPGMALDDGRVFADFVADIVARRDIVMKSDGRTERAFCYLSDATRGFLTVLLRGVAGQAYNVGNPASLTSIGALAETLTGLFPERRLNVVQQPPAGDYLQSRISRNWPDIAKSGALGWLPSVGLEDGFRRTVSSFEKAKEL